MYYVWNNQVPLWNYFNMQNGLFQYSEWIISIFRMDYFNMCNELML
jgi:hypothetical protein